MDSLTDIERRFIELVYANAHLRTFDEAAQELGCSRAEISKMSDGLRDIWKPITEVRRLWLRKKVGGNFWDFEKWHSGEQRKCYYCGICEAEINTLSTQRKYRNRRHPRRGPKLELDRKNPVVDYTQMNNLVLACYWCNNAKTDTFTEEEGKIIGTAVSQIWKRRLNHD